MREVITAWGIPKIKSLNNKDIVLIFENSELQTEHELCGDLHCRKESVWFCLYDRNTEQVIFVFNFFESSNFMLSRSLPKTLTIDTIVVIDPELRNQGIASYYLIQLRKYAEKNGIEIFNIYADVDNDAFDNLNKEKTLQKLELKSFYRKYLESAKTRINFMDEIEI